MLNDFENRTDCFLIRSVNACEFSQMLVNKWGRKDQINYCHFHFRGFILIVCTLFRINLLKLINLCLKFCFN